MKKKCCDNSAGQYTDDEFIKSDTYEECVYYAFYNKNGKKYDHQRRIPKDKLNTYKDKLLPLESEFKKCNNFDNIHELFKKHKTKGIGDLTVYDVSFLVGQNYGIYPDKVYLHAGTKTGALNAGLIKKYSRKKFLTIDEISAKLKWLKNVEPYLIENFLCIYKDKISEKSLKEYLLGKL